MTRPEVVVPALVRQVAGQLGTPGEAWLAGLPALLADLQRDWALRVVGGPLPGGSRSYVVRVLLADGLAAVLKLAVPDPGFPEQVRALCRANGRGYVGVLAADVERGAVLLEALGPAMDQLALPPEAQIDALCATLRAAWQLPKPPGATLDQAQAKAVELAGDVARMWADLGHPCPQRVVSRAVRFAERRAAATDLDRAVVVHGDPHPGNALPVLAPRAGAESGFVLVDPNGFLADPAYDLGVVLRDWCPQLLAAGAGAPALAWTYCRLLAAHSGLDPTAIWEWGFVERVSSGLYLRQLGADELAEPFLATAGLLS